MSSSRFISGGTNEDEEPTTRDEAWLKAQQALEAKQTEQKAGQQQQQDDGKSLYETLQANKAAKQEAFEEASRLKNQFRSLEEDEVDFLDSVLESTRAREAEVRRETRERVEAFRRCREEVEKKEEEEEMAGAWTTAGPRKRKKGPVIGGVKVRRTSAGVKAVEAEEGGVDHPVKATAVDKKESSPKVQAQPSKSPSPPAAGLGLAAYSSDEDD